MKDNQKGDSTPWKTMALVAITFSLLFVCGMAQRPSAPQPELHVTVLMAGTQGGDNQPEPSTKWIRSQEELERLFDGLNALHLPAQEVNTASNVDFSTSRVLLVSMGQKPTAGYSIKLDPESCSISKNTALVSLTWSEPDPGLVTAQVITSPFILLKLSKDGYDAVKIVDQHGQTRFDLLVAD